MLAVSGCTLIGGGLNKPEQLSLYDFGPLQAQSAKTLNARLPAVSVAEVNAPAWLDSSMMYFRLLYANGQQPRPYASSRWTMPPAQLFGQRLKARIAQAGGVVLSSADGAANVPVLRIEADDFTQNFDSPAQSNAQLAVRASLFNGHVLVAQKTFIRQSPAPSADAAGGARALATAADAVIDEMMTWLAALPLRDVHGITSRFGRGKRDAVQGVPSAV